MTTGSRIRPPAARHPRGPVPGAVSRLSRRGPGRRDPCAAAAGLDLPRKVAPYGRYRQSARVGATGSVASDRGGARSSSRSCRRRSRYVGPADQGPTAVRPGRNGLITYASKGDIYVGGSGLRQGGRDRHGSAARREPSSRRTAPGSPSDARSKVRFRWPRISSSSSPMDRTPLVVTETPIVGGPKRLEWSPDSQSILATAPDDSAIWLFDATRKAPVRTIATDRWAYFRPFQPPGGKALLIARSGGGKHSVIAYDVATGHETVLAADLDGEDGAAGWSPDGSQVVYNAAPKGEPGVVAAVRRPCGRHGNSAAQDRTRHLARGRPRVVAGRAPDRLYPLGAVRPDSGSSGQSGSTRWQTGPCGPSARCRARSAPGTRRRTTDRPAQVKPSTSTGRLTADHCSPYPSEATGHAIIIDTTDGTWRALDPVLDAVGAPARRAGSVSRPDRRPRGPTTRTKEEPRVVGPGVQGVGGLVAGRGFEPLTFGL